MSWSKAVRALAAGAVVVGSVAGAGAVSAAPPAPDLVVTAVAVPPGNGCGPAGPLRGDDPEPGERAHPAGTISGIGFQVDGRLVTWSDQFTDSLRRGAPSPSVRSAAPRSATWTATAGTHRLRAFVDDAARIRESNEGNNTLDTTFSVAAGIAHRVQGDTVVLSFAAVPGPSITATSVTGNAFAGASPRTGPGGRFGAVRADPLGGNDTWAFGRSSPTAWGGSPPGDPGPDPRELHATAVRLPARPAVTCAAGQTPAFTRFQATSVRTTRWLGDVADGGPQIASVSTPVDVDFDVQP